MSRLFKGLLARNFIYSGSQQWVAMSVFDNAIPLRLTLQPFVYQALDYYKPKIEEIIHKLELKMNNEKDSIKKTKLVEQLRNSKENFCTIYDNGGTR